MRLLSSVFPAFFQSVKGGAWSSKGCSVASSNSTHTVCHMTHLTSFAVIMQMTHQQVGLINGADINVGEHVPQCPSLVTKLVRQLAKLFPNTL